MHGRLVAQQRIEHSPVVVGSIPVGESDFLLSYAYAMFEDFMLDYWMRFTKYTKVIR